MRSASYNGVMRRCLRQLLLWYLVSTGMYAADPAFDLVGPKVDVHVKRGEVTLPIAQVPNLMPGDRLWIHPDFPESQSAHYVLIVAFLRGATNPPPLDWFTRVETWQRSVRNEGVFVTVPQEAQQALFFLAPETGGDFATLRQAVRSRPGAFVRSAQDLQAASLERMRIESYLSEVKTTSQTDPRLLKERAEKAARSLGVKVEQQCFDKPADQQAACLVSHTEGMVFDDTGTLSRVEQLTSGSTRDLMNQLAYTPMGGAGALSPYVGAIVDTARILSSLHTAHYQYIPALALPSKDSLNLRLNMPPSFRDPKSVVVVGLPAVGAPARMPPLHPINPSERFCAQKGGLVLPSEGEPLAFSTDLIHGLKLHLETGTGALDLPLEADPAAGGLVLVHPPVNLPPGNLNGEVQGKYGFDDWEGPHFFLHSAGPGNWTLAPGDQSALVVGRDDTLHIEGSSSLCIDKLDEQTAGGAPVNLAWKSLKPGSLEVTVPMKDTSPGPVSLHIWQFGLTAPDTLALKAYAEAGSLDRLTLSAGDAQAVLRGTRLDEVASASLNGIVWTPGALNRVEAADELTMKADSSTSGLEPGRRYSATVLLKDGRQTKVPVIVDRQRPQVSMMSKGWQQDASTSPSPVHLGSPNDIPLDGRLVFFLKSSVPANFPRSEKVEVGAADGSFHTELTLADGSLMLEDSKTAVGTLEPLARFGPSAFGPIQARALAADGVTGDWMPLGTLVRLPGFKELHCPRAAAKPCTLTGSNLFLALSIAATPDFDSPAEVPIDFTGAQLSVPHPIDGALYLKLRDDPTVVQTLTLPVMPAAASPPSTEPQAPPPSDPASQPAKTNQ